MVEDKQISNLLNESWNSVKRGTACFSFCKKVFLSYKPAENDNKYTTVLAKK